jgi:hypothetical protein
MRLSAFAPPLKARVIENTLTQIESMSNSSPRLKAPKGGKNKPQWSNERLEAKQS